MDNARDAAFEKGRTDRRRYEQGSQRDPIGIGHALSELICPTYSPPSKNSEAYKAGWEEESRKK